MKKWNYKTHSYEDFNPPHPAPPMMCDDMEQIIQCAECGKKVEFGKAYTSKQIHNDFGFGYPICEECYEKEVVIERQSK